MDWSHKEPLRVLFLASNPADTGKLELEEEYRKVEKARQALIAAGAAGPVNLVRRDNVGLDDLIPFVAEFRPHVLHFAGHGDLTRAAAPVTPPHPGRWRGLYILDEHEQPLDPIPDETPPGGILLADDKGRARRLSDEVLIRLCKVKEIRDHLRLVLLNACWGAGQAEKIVNEAGIPFAIGMSKPIDDPAAIRFARGFYSLLFNPDYSLYSAFDSGCNQIQTQSRAGQEKVPRLFGDERRAQALQLFVELPMAGLANLPTKSVPARAPLPAPTNMTLPPNEAFVGREEEMKEIARALKVNARAAVAAGIGGAGKTQLAIEWAHRYGQYFPGGVLWLDFSEPEEQPAEDRSANAKSDDGNSRAPFSIIAAGRHYDIPGYDAMPPDEQIRVTRARWERTTTLLIFDNCESQSLAQKYLPSPGGARVLLTSRDGAWDNPTTSIKQIEVATLPPDKSIELLQKLYPALSYEHADAIAAELDNLPLALHIAGSFLAQYKDKVSPDSYIALLRRPDLIERLSKDGARLKHELPTKHNYSVLVTFLISIRKLDNESDTLARALLLLLAHFAPGAPVPEEWLARAAPDDSDPLDVTDALGRLIAVGLAERAGDDSLRMHRLIALAALSDAGADARARAETQSEKILLAVKPEYGTAAFIPLMEAWQPHARHIVTRALPRRDARASLLANEFGFLLEKLALYNQVLPLYEEALGIRREALGSRHPDTATSLNNLAGLYESQGEYARALPLYEEALSIRREMLGGHHPETAISSGNLAGLYESIGEYTLSLPLREEALNIHRKVLGERHPDTATSLNNLAGLYESQGKYAQALLLFEEALAIYRKVLGNRHPSTAISFNNLANLYHQQGEYGRALPLYEEALAIRREVLGDYHPDTAISLDNLAGLYCAQGEYGRALPLYEEALEIQRTILGARHPDTALSLNNLAELYRAQGEYERALPLCEEALSIRHTMLGAYHPDTATSLNNVATLYFQQGEYELALPMLEEALTIKREALGERHPSIAIGLNNLAGLYYQHGSYERAQSLLEKALEITRVVLGNHHPDIATSLNNLAGLYGGLGEHARALPLLEEAVSIMEERLGRDHPDTILSIANCDACRAALERAQ